jgi:hypothetical protein
LNLIGSRNENSDRPLRSIGVSVLLASVMLLVAGCFGGEEGPEDEKSTLERLGTDDPCAFVDLANASSVLFGSSPGDGQAEEIQDSYIGCSNRLGIKVEGQEVGSMDLVAQVFERSGTGSPGDNTPTADQIEWFKPAGQEEFNEVTESSVNPIDGSWDAGEAYVLDGLFRNRDLYIVGAWGEVNGFEFGVAFKVTAEQEYFDQPLVYNEYCNETDLNAGCIVSSDQLYQWMTSEYLPSVAAELVGK